MKDFNKIAEQLMKAAGKEWKPAKIERKTSSPKKTSKPKTTSVPKATVSSPKTSVNFNKVAGSIMKAAGHDWKPASAGKAKPKVTVPRPSSPVLKSRKAVPGTFGKTVKSLPLDIQGNLEEISRNLKAFNNAKKRMEANPNISRQQANSFINNFRSSNPELYDMLENLEKDGQLNTGKKAIRNAIKEYYESKGIPYDERTMLAEISEQFASDYARLNEAGHIRPKEFVENLWKQVNLVDKAIVPNLSIEEAEAINPEIKVKIAEKFFELKELNKYSLIKSDELLQEAWQSIKDEHSDEFAEFVQDEAMNVFKDSFDEVEDEFAFIFGDKKFR